MIINVSKGSVTLSFAVLFLNDIATKLDSTKEAIIDHGRKRLEKMKDIKVLDLKDEKVCFFVNENDFDVRGNFKFENGDI